MSEKKLINAENKKIQLHCTEIIELKIKKKKIDSLEFSLIYRVPQYFRKKIPDLNAVQKKENCSNL